MFGNQLNGVTKVVALPYSLNDMIGIITLAGTVHHSDLKRSWIADGIGVGAVTHLASAGSYGNIGATIAQTVADHSSTPNKPEKEISKTEKEWSHQTSSNLPRDRSGTGSVIEV